MFKFICNFFKVKNTEEAENKVSDFEKMATDENNFEEPSAILESDEFQVRVFRIVKAISFEEAIEETVKVGGKLLGHKGIDIYRGAKRPECLCDRSALIYSMGETVEEMSYLLQSGAYYFFKDSEHQKINGGEYVLVFIEL